MRFFLIDKIHEWHVGASARATKNIALSEDFFDDHFPRRPIMPGTLIVEGLAQLSGLLLEASLKAQYQESAKAVLTVVERTKFRDMARPGDTLTYVTEIVSVNKTGGKASARALRGDQVIVTSGMLFAFKYIDDPLLDAKRASLMDLWMSLPDVGGQGG